MFFAFMLCNFSVQMHPAITPQSEDKYVVKVFNWSEVHLSEMTCSKIHTLIYTCHILLKITKARINPNMIQSFSSRIYLVSHHSGRFDKILSKNIFLLIKSKKYVTIKWCKPNMISIFCISYKSKSLRNNKNSQNFGIICHTEVCLTFSRLAAKLLEMIAKFLGRSNNKKLKYGISGRVSIIVFWSQDPYNWYL